MVANLGLKNTVVVTHHNELTMHPTDPPGESSNESIEITNSPPKPNPGLQEEALTFRSGYPFHPTNWDCAVQ